MTVHVFDTMGTTASLRFAGALPQSAVLADVEGCFRDLDERFSLYRPDSELSCIARGELALQNSTLLLREAYSEALLWRSRTSDSFTPHRPDGVIDLSGLIKAKAMDEAGQLLTSAGAEEWVMNVGGDILSSGRCGGAHWSVGVVDPDDRRHLLCAIELTTGRPALATSGTAERGEHIWRSDRQSDRRSDYRQVTVIAADIVSADVLATAIIAGGAEQRDDVVARFDVEVLTVDGHGEITATEGLRDARGIAPA